MQKGYIVDFPMPECIWRLINIEDAVLGLHSKGLALGISADDIGQELDELSEHQLMLGR